MTHPGAAAVHGPAAVRTWSDSPFPRVLHASRVPEGGIVAPVRGASRTYATAGSPGWLATVHERPLPEADAARLERLIALPGSMTPAERAVVDRHTCWPVARIAGAGGTTGVVTAQPPERFYVRMRGSAGQLKAPEPLLLGWLTVPPERAGACGLGVIAPPVRIRAMREVLAVGALFEKHGVVHAAWSHTTVLWQLHVGSALVVAMDGCGIGTRAWTRSPGWCDPLYPDGGTPLTSYSDRYQLAVLAVRCLTGLRGDPLAAYALLDAGIRRSAFGAALGRALTATDPAARPTAAELLRACGASGVGGGWDTAPPPGADGAQAMGAGGRIER